jgi:type I restriction enzyme, R subunit
VSNFAFLETEWSMLFEAASKAESFANSDPRASCFYARRALEISVAWLYTHDQAFRLPYQDNLSALIYEPSFIKSVGDALFTKARLIKDLGNLAVHGAKKIAISDALNATRELFHFCYWLARTYGRTRHPLPGLAFSLDLVPKPIAGVPQTKTLEQIKRLNDELRAKDERLSVLLADKTVLDEELLKLREKVTAAKKANTTQPDTHDYSEAETRRAFIDLMLKEAGWSLNPAKDHEVKVTGMPNGKNTGYVDYVLWGDDGKPLALIEAKRTTKSPLEGEQQAKLYGDCLERQYGQRPVIFLSNGYENWIWDDLSYPKRALQGFYKKAELEFVVQRRASRKKLAEAIIDSTIVERYYQTRAIRRVGETFEVENQRKALLVMATGAGKTRTVIALADVLMRCNWAKRILFLADRVALVKQAVGAFKMFLPDASPVNLLEEKYAEGRVFVSTYPTMMGLIDETQNGAHRFGVGHFDLVVIDEAHRSVYRKYRAIFKYFDSLLVGLTATPKDEVDKDTYGLFDLEKGVPTDAYSLDEGIADKYLVPPVPISVPLKFQREGIRYDDLSDEEKEQWDVLEWDDEGTTPTEVDPEAINKWLFNIDTVDKALEVLMNKGQKVAGGDVLGKTIIFAKNNDHAAFIAERFDINYPQYKGHFARMVTYKTEYAQSLIDDFSKPAKMPHIAISVDMLDTGIDVPEVVNLFFFKVVRSKTKFWQMVGRGTRLCSDLFGPGENKKSFFIFDFCQNLEFFNANHDFAEGATAESLGTRLFKTRLEMIGALDEQSGGIEASQPEPTPYGGHLTKGQLRAETAALLHSQVAAMNVDNFVVRPQRQFVEKFSQPSTWELLSPEDFHELTDHIAGLPTTLTDSDEEAKRFDMLVLRAQLAILQGGTGFAGQREKIQRIAGELEAQIAIPAIKAQIALISEVASDDWWEDVTVPMLETARRRLRALIKLIPKGKKKIVYTDFEDELGEASEITLPQVTAGLNMAKFKEKARMFLRAHENHLALQRLRRNHPLTATDLEELERMLVEAGGSPELITAATEQNDGLGIFIRSLVGLEREAAMQAFSNFIDRTTATPDQIEFINLVVEELIQNGVMDVSRLYETPFVDMSPSGPEGIFPSAQLDQFVTVLDLIRSRAAA